MTAAPTVEFHPGKRPHELPKARKIDSHMQVIDHEGPIILVTGREKRKWMTALLEHVAPKSCPRGKADALDQGYVILNGKDDPVVIWRNELGSGQESDDEIVLWVRPGRKVGPEEVGFMRNVQARIIGDERDIDNHKARRQQDGSYVGGVAFERNPRAVSVEEGNRAYPIATSHQASRGLNAPQRGRKTMGRPLDEHGKLVKDILKVGATAGMAGLSKGPEGLADLLRDRAEYLNTPKVGIDTNTAFPTFQLNIASAVEADDDTTLESSLGRYGSAHADSGDSASAMTAMTCLTPKHEDAEADIFFILDCGVGIILNEFDTVFFCGGRFHGGLQPRYKAGPRVSPGKAFIRVTLIGYGPATAFDIPASEAFIAAPGKDGILRVFTEMRDWSGHLPFVRVPGSQANFTTDADALMTPTSALDHFARSIVQIAAYAAEQYPLHHMIRIDREKMLSSVSAVIDGVRTSAGPWPLGPGHTGNDVQIGTCYSEDFTSMSKKELRMCRNSDTHSPYPYGNEVAYEHVGAWRAHQEAMTKTVPLCVQGDVNEITGEVAANPNKRRTVTKNIRNGKGVDGKKKTVITAGTVTARLGPAPRKLFFSHVEITSSRRVPSRCDKPDNHHRPDARDTHGDTGGTTSAVVGAVESRAGSVKGVEPETRKRKRRGRSNALEATTTLPQEPGDTEDDIDDDLEFLADDEPASRPSKRRRTARDDAEDSREKRGSKIRRLPDHTSLRARTDETGRLLAALHPDELSSTLSGLQQLQLSVTSPIPEVHDVAGELSKLFETNRVSEIWNVRSAMERMRQTQTLASIVTRGQLMQVDWVTWVWLVDNIEQAYSSVKGDHPHWLRKLGHRVHTLVTSGTSDTLDAFDYLDTGVEKGEHTYKVKAMPVSKRLDTLHNFSCVMRPLLMEWLNFPRKPQDVTRCLLLEAIVARFGFGALFVPEVGELHSHISRAIDPMNRKPTLSSGMAFVNRLQAELAESKYDGVVSQLHVLKIRYSIDLSTIVRVAERAGAMSEWTASDPTPEHPPYVPSEFGTFLDQINRLNPILSNPTELPPAPPHGADRLTQRTYKYVKHVFDNQDKKLPFRDLALSRRAILADNGPYSPAHLFTRSGFFSAIIYRAITHHSRFLTERHEILFSDLTDFQNRIASHQRGRTKSKSYFCDPAAYGACTNLSVDHASMYWKASGDSEINGWLLNRDPIRFWDLASTFISSNKLPNIGPLIGYLLAADYAIAGAVEMPDPKEMGRVIHRVGMGSWKGLRKMGFKCDTEDDTASSFEYLYREVCRRIPVEARDAMRFNVFVLEHMLCKYLKRLDVAVYRAIFK